MFGGEACNITVVGFSGELVPALQEQQQVRNERSRTARGGRRQLLGSTPHS